MNAAAAAAASSRKRERDEAKVEARAEKAQAFEAALRRGEEDPRRKKREENKHLHIQEIQPLVQWEMERINNRAKIIRHHLRHSRSEFIKNLLRFLRH